jgi:hypothetical protein
MQLPQDILDHYGSGNEQERLSHGAGRSEAPRTRELLSRWLPSAPALVLGVGGAAGRYALPLAAAGYQVHLLDPVPLHGPAGRAGRPVSHAAAGLGADRRRAHPAVRVMPRGMPSLVCTDRELVDWAPGAAPALSAARLQRGRSPLPGVSGCRRFRRWWLRGMLGPREW